MSDERKYMDPADFRREGFLQEANRLFFHPHGLALSVRIIESEWTDAEVAESPWMQAKLDAVRAAVQALGLVEGACDDPVEEHQVYEYARTICARLWPKGSVHLADVWDSDDPEGIVFGDGDTATNAARVRTRRDRYFRPRLALFGSGADPEYPHILEGPDVEPLDWVYEEPSEADG